MSTIDTATRVVADTSTAGVTPIPDNYPQLVPYLCVEGADAAIAFYCTVFGATERMRMAEPDGRLGHAELDAGAPALSPPENQFYGDRTGRFEDPFGHRWSVATHVEDVSSQDMAQRAAARSQQEFGP